MYTKDETRSFTFGSLTITVKNWRGVFTGLSNTTKERIKALSIDEAKEANRAAWKQKNASDHRVNQSCNMSYAGNADIYEAHCAISDIAAAVAKETYKRMMNYI